MKLLFIHDHPFFQDENLVYTSGSLSRELWKNNYLPYFDTITVIGRYSTNLNHKIMLSSEENVNFNLIKEYTSVRKFFFNYLKIKNKIKREILISDLTAVRLPSVFGILAVFILVKYKKPFFIEVVNNFKEALLNHGLLIGKIIAHYAHKLMKECVKKSYYTIYVTHKLKDVYQNDKFTRIISDVMIPEILLYTDIQKNRFYSENLRIGLIGGFSIRYKGQDILLKAVSLLDNHIKETIELYFIGIGDYDWIHTMAEGLNLHTNIRFIGSLPHNEVISLLKKLSLYVQPSLIEGMPRAMIEAMSMGCPVLASAVGGIPDIINGNFLHQRGDYKKLSDQIKNFYENRDILEKEAFHSLDMAMPFLKEKLDKKRNDFFVKIISSIENTNSKI